MWRSHLLKRFLMENSIFYAMIWKYRSLSSKANQKLHALVRIVKLWARQSTVFQRNGLLFHNFNFVQHFDYVVADVLIIKLTISMKQSYAYIIKASNQKSVVLTKKTITTHLRNLQYLAVTLIIIKLCLLH